ncbi:cell division protein ZapA [Miniphocaeibacter halophilus]|uniref:Cell division protein ZapA n=1 Tax=Miniphocaeibacter halophilus TaxID=2931922 RepID=A0AC61MPU3_9FIRM|nr:cell division protein ZapA [Miniphocaeibacter halophilus]QQK07524.1 cell division protein ZapA [Miniphocaeibacter halophilus]
MSEKTKYNIRILNNTYTIKSDKSEEAIDEITSKINSKLSELRKNNPNLKQEMLLSLALLYFSEEITNNDLEISNLRDEIDSFRQEKRTIKEKNENFIKNINQLEKDNLKLKEDINLYLNNINKLNQYIETLKIETSNYLQELEGKNNTIKKLNDNMDNLRRDYTQTLIIVNSVKRELEKIKGKVL